MFGDKIGLIELMIFLLLAFVLPSVVILRDDRNWERKPQRRRAASAAAGASRPAGEVRDATGLASGQT